MFHFVGQGSAFNSIGFTRASKSIGLPATPSPDSDLMEIKKILPGIDHVLKKKVYFVK